MTLKQTPKPHTHIHTREKGEKVILKAKSKPPRAPNTPYIYKINPIGVSGNPDGIVRNGKILFKPVKVLINPTGVL